MVSFFRVIPPRLETLSIAVRLVSDTKWKIVASLSFKNLKINQYQQLNNIIRDLKRVNIKFLFLFFLLPSINISIFVKKAIVFESITLLSDFVFVTFLSPQYSRMLRRYFRVR